MKIIRQNLAKRTQPLLTSAIRFAIVIVILTGILIGSVW
jgi:hypothetical protein